MQPKTQRVENVAVFVVSLTLCKKPQIVQMIVRTRILPTFPIRLKSKGIIAHFFREIQQAPVLPECLPVLSKIGCALLYGTLSVNFRNNIRQELLAVDNITNLLVAVNLTLDGDMRIVTQCFKTANQYREVCFAFKCSAT